MAERVGIDEVGRDSAVLSAVEIGLGSVLHGLKLPFSGHFLSLNQGFLLARGVYRERAKQGVRSLPARVSGVAALLKSLSPAGKKLTPMLAISAQGILFSMGVFALGPNVFGVALGLMISSLWAFVQPLLLYYLLFGNALIDVAAYYLKQVQAVFPIDEKSLLFVVMGLVAVKLALALALAILARFLSEATARRYETALLKTGDEKRRRVGELGTDVSLGESARHAVRDLLNPLFLLTFGLTGLFFFFSESPWSMKIWMLLRPLALGFLVFFLVRLIPAGWLPSSLRIAVLKLKEIG